MGITLILTGVACIVGAIIGGGVKLLQVEMRVVESRWRQYLLGAFGGALILGGLFANGTLSFPSRNAEARGVESAKAEPAPPPAADGNASAPEEKSEPATPSEAAPEKKPAEEATPIAAPAIPSADALLAGLRLHVGEVTGDLGGRQVHRVAIWLELPERQRRALGAVRYEFYNPTFKSPKYAERGSETFRARWQGYGCIQDAAVIASTASGEVRAPFDLCTLWREGRLGGDEKS